MKDSSGRQIEVGDKVVVARGREGHLIAATVTAIKERLGWSRKTKQRDTKMQVVNYEYLEEGYSYRGHVMSSQRIMVIS